MMWLDGSTTTSCASWTLLPLMLLEIVQLGVILWRTCHQTYWHSHPRRIFFHIVLLLSCGLRLLFWLGLCKSPVLTVGVACLWWSNTLVLLCTAAVIFQWSSALTAGRETAQERHRSKRITLLHVLVCLHSIHFIWTTVLCIRVIVIGLPTPNSDIEDDSKHAHVLLLTHRMMNIVTLAYDVVVASYVAIQLKERVLTAAVSDDMKKKSVVQMSLLMTLLIASLTLQMLMDVPYVILNRGELRQLLSLEAFCILKYVLPSLCLNVAFLYIMRRVEQRDSTRVVNVSNRSLIEFIECSSSDCVWCAHHRRYHCNQNKWGLTPLTSISPRTVDSSFHSSIRANLSQNSWSSESTSDGHPFHPFREFQAQDQIQERAYSVQMHGNYEPPPEIPKRPRDCFI
ncbi:hypothetical protein CCR75_002443 [Bremia lactucae]|uniref:Uncharacterized protein n=1 Tax=Bremia lactucae TaxID=4779 RepID=A0A976FI52_BRELC|nr:hypothetical protein CCR75_002443 [Bremia lactucae]